MELKIEHICGFLPYGLLCMVRVKKGLRIALLGSLTLENCDDVIKYKATPILIPLSKLSDEQYAEVGGIIMDAERHSSFKTRDGKDWLKGSMQPVMSPSTALKAIAYLHSIKADIHGLCAAGIAIDATTLETNPYQ